MTDILENWEELYIDELNEVKQSNSQNQPDFQNQPEIQNDNKQEIKLYELKEDIIDELISNFKEPNRIKEREENKKKIFKTNFNEETIDLFIECITSNISNNENLNYLFIEKIFKAQKKSLKDEDLKNLKIKINDEQNKRIKNAKFKNKSKKKKNIIRIDSQLKDYSIYNDY